MIYDILVLEGHFCPVAPISERQGEQLPFLPPGPASLCMVMEMPIETVNLSFSLSFNKDKIRQSMQAMQLNLHLSHVKYILQS